MSNRELRFQLETLAEIIINLLDRLDGDPDLEDDGCAEEDSDQDRAPIFLDLDRKQPRKVA
jgi:hypothetical protein